MTPCIFTLVGPYLIGFCYSGSGLNAILQDQGIQDIKPLKITTIHDRDSEDLGAKRKISKEGLVNSGFILPLPIC